MMHVSKQRLYSLSCVASRPYVLVPSSNTSYGNSLGKAPLIPVKLVLWVFN